jgi:hypothetical protein
MENYFKSLISQLSAGNLTSDQLFRQLESSSDSLHPPDTSHSAHIHNFFPGSHKLTDPSQFSSQSSQSSAQVPQSKPTPAFK